MVITNSSTLYNRYVVQSVLGEVGPFDVNYLAWDLVDEHEVVLREYYPLPYAKRADDGLTLEVHDAAHFEYGLGAYTAEAHRLIDITHPHIVKYTDNFKENGTIYAVLEFISGASTYGYMTQQGGALPEEEALAIMDQIMRGLHVCHSQHVYHGGMWPKAIHLTPNGRPVLMGFSLARFQMARHCDRIEQVALPGFTAPEQRDEVYEPGPGWDVFGCAATLFYLLTGYQLSYQRGDSTEEGIKRALHHEGNLSTELRNVLEHALAFHPDERPSSVDMLREMLIDASINKPLLTVHTQPYVNGSSKDRLLPETNSGDSIPGPLDSTPIIEDVSAPEVPAPVPEPIPEPAPEPVKITPPPTAEPPPPVSPERPFATPIPTMPLDPTTPETPHQPIPEPIITDSAMPASNGVRSTNSTEIVKTVYQQRSLLIEEETARTEPETETEASTSAPEMTQLLARMVKWQQRLIAFILAFVFMVILVAFGFFVGPRMGFNLGASSSSTLPEGATASSPSLLSLQNLPANIQDSLASVTTLIVGPESREQATPERATPPPAPRQQQTTTNNTTDNTRRETTQARQSPQSQATPEASETSQRNASQQTSALATTESEDEEAPADSLLQARDDSLAAIAAAQAAEEAAQREAWLQTQLQDREYEMYRSLADSLLQQGLEDMAVVWYRSALQQKPGDLYATEQLNKIEAAEAATQARTDSMARRLMTATDDNGYFIAPDVQPVMINRADVYRSIVFPAACEQQTQGGRVIARVLIDERGRTSEASIIRPLHPQCDAEVLRALDSATFDPGMFSGEAVKAWYAFSVVFQSQ